MKPGDSELRGGKQPQQYCEVKQDDRTFRSLALEGAQGEASKFS